MMPSKRSRTARGAAVSELIIETLGIGSGISFIPDVELREMWREHGEQASKIWMARFGELCFVEMILRESGWITSDGKMLSEAEGLAS